MAGTSVLIATVFCIFFITFTEPVNFDVHKYALLIADVHKYYDTSFVVFVHSNSNDLSATTFTHTWSRKLSDRNIASVTITFHELITEARTHKHRIDRSLFVVLIDTVDSMNKFAEATKHIRISIPTWFVIFAQKPGNPLEDYCQNPTGNLFNLLFNTEMLVLCYDHPTLKEWYALEGNHTRVFSLATWTPETGLILRTKNSLYVRRGNMFGKTLRVTTVEDSPFITTKNGVPSHLFGGILLELSNVINFNLEILKPVDAYGSWNEEEKAWTGVIDQLVTGKADFGVSEFTMTNHRLQVVDFTLPLLLSRNRLYIKQPDGTAVKWSGYFKAFEMDIWAALIIIIITAPVLLTIIKTRGYVVLKIILDSYINVWGIYCQQGLSEFPDEPSLRVAFVSIFVSALLVSSAYSASLISFLTVTTVGLPFTSVEGFINDGSYKLIVFRNSADYDMIVNAKDDIFIKLRKLLKKQHELPVTLMEGFQQVCSEKVAFYTTEAIKNAVSYYLPCNIVFIETGRADSLAMTLIKDSPYTGLINYHLQRFKDNGMISRLKATNLFVPETLDSPYVPVSFWGIAPILAVLGGGFALGCCVLMFEKAYYYASTNQSKSICSILKKFGASFDVKPYDEEMKKNDNKKFRVSEKYDLEHNERTLGYWP